MADIITEKELRDLKLKIKNWESEFTHINSRKPGKEDIRQASYDIKEAYKSYWKYKNKAEVKKVNRDDVWSEKLNKSAKKNSEFLSSNETLKKFCHKIRERVSVPNQSVDVKTPLHFRNLKSNASHAEKLENGELCINNTHNESIDCSASELNNLETDLLIIKPTKKIIKHNNVHKKVKTVNVLSSSVDIKSLENNLCFDNNLNSDWLERCCNSVLNTSCETVDSPENSHISLNKACISDIPENINVEAHSNNKVASFSCNHIEKECPEVTNSVFNVKCINDVSETFCVQSPLQEEIFTRSSPRKNEKNIELTPCSQLDDSSQSHMNEKNIELTPCSQLDDKHCSTQSLSDNEKYADIQEDTKNRKRKLTKVYSANHKPISHLERKIASGTLNENFVRVNIKKKKFSRGHRVVNVRKLKWKKWKQLKASGGSEIDTSSSACFKCGQIGHWARNCKVLTKNDQFSDSVVEDFEDAPLPTLEEAAELAKKSKVDLFKVKTVKAYGSSHCSSSKNGENDIQQAWKDNSVETENINDANPIDRIVNPFYELAANEKPIETPKEVFIALKELGYTNFRKGQETAVMRILSGLSTLVVLPTGSGKSLCYQLPAYIYAKKSNCIAIVISPLVSLMEDQVTGLPSCLHAVCLHSGMTDVQKKASVQDITEGKAQILLVSPEAVIGGLGYGSGILPFNLPPISFACIDEAHCLSQWSHNFRPSYLQLYKVLTQRLNVKCILGLTATANQSTAKEITLLLELKSVEECVVGTTSIPSNLHISVSRDKDRDRALIQLLSGDRFSSCSSIIIYCIRRDETERLATLIRTCLQDRTSSDEPPTKKLKAKLKKRNFLWTAEAYHAGLAPPRRRSIQKQFMNGKLRVIVATVAFGMGLDKRDVRAVIHYNMPKSFESYVQEIGRAGRDGLDSHCHLFLDNEGKDIQELQRHIYSNSTDRHIIRKLLRKVFLPCKCNQLISTESAVMQNGSYLQANCPKHEIAFPINDAVLELDLKEENISTFLCYLELHSKQWIEVLSPTYATCTIRCYGGPKQLRALASKSPPVAAGFALDVKKGRNLDSISTYEFPVVEVASFMGWNAASVKRELKQLEWNDQKRKTGVIVGFSNLAFHLNAPCNLSDDELDNILDFLHEKVITSEKKEILNLKSLCSIFTKFSHPHYWSCCDEAPVEYSEGIKEAINEYFDETGNLDGVQHLESEISLDSSDVDIFDVRNQIRDIIYTNNDQNFTGRAIARIFHGIGSPCYPPEVWGKVRKFWRCLLHVNFNLLIKLANEELKNAK